MVTDNEKGFVLNQENFLKLWRMAMEHESAINTLFDKVDKLKKKR
jgi:hypothetical protein